jgi:hypothetical protein
MYIKHHTKICHWYLLVVILKIDIKYTFLVRFYIFSRNDRFFIDWCDVIARANIENCYQNSGEYEICNQKIILRSISRQRPFFFDRFHP